MWKYILIILIAISALVLTYKPDIVLKYILNKEELQQKDILMIKFIALAVGIADFILAMILL